MQTNIRKPLLVAHRGESFLMPENTIPALTFAWKNKPFAVETDVHITSDNQLIAAHDYHFQRTAGVNREIKDMTADEITVLDVGAWKAPEFAGIHPPLFDEVLAAMPSDGRLYMEIKVDDPRFTELFRTLMEKRQIRQDQVTIISFFPESLARLNRDYPGFTTSLLLGGEETYTIPELIKKLRRLGCAGVSPHYQRPWIAAEPIEELHAAGFGVHVWTVDTIEEAHQCALAGVDTITTNRAEWMNRNW